MCLVSCFNVTRPKFRKENKFDSVFLGHRKTPDISKGLDSLVYPISLSPRDSVLRLAVMEERALGSSRPLPSHIAGSLGGLAGAYFFKFTKSQNWDQALLVHSGLWAFEDGRLPYVFDKSASLSVYENIKYTHFSEENPQSNQLTHFSVKKPAFNL